MNSFEKVDINTLSDNFFRRIGSDWMLITAGDSEKCNTMTASWGGTGVLWSKNVVFAFIRQSRYTLEFVNSKDYFSLSFFGGRYRKELTFCGQHSGRDVDKLRETGFTPVFDAEAPYMEQAEMVLICRKLYRQTTDESCFLDKSLIKSWYPDGDRHEVFVAEIISVLKKSE